MGSISTVEYLGDLRTEAVHLQSGDRILTDAPKDNEGKGSARSVFGFDIGAQIIKSLNIKNLAFEYGLMDIFLLHI